MTNEELADRIITFMNDLLTYDRVAVSKLILYRMPYSEWMVEHPTVQVHVDGPLFCG